MPWFTLGHCYLSKRWAMPVVACRDRCSGFFGSIVPVWSSLLILEHTGALLKTGAEVDSLVLWPKYAPCDVELWEPSLGCYFRLLEACSETERLKTSGRIKLPVSFSASAALLLLRCLDTVIQCQIWDLGRSQKAQTQLGRVTFVEGYWLYMKHQFKTNVLFIVDQKR